MGRTGMAVEMFAQENRVRERFVARQTVIVNNKEDRSAFHCGDSESRAGGHTPHCESNSRMQLLVRRQIALMRVHLQTAVNKSIQCLIERWRSARRTLPHPGCEQRKAP
jgi:hypothetical protein